jgi:hypothetical protein
VLKALVETRVGPWLCNGVAKGAILQDARPGRPAFHLRLNVAASRATNHGGNINRGCWFLKAEYPSANLAPAHP